MCAAASDQQVTKVKLGAVSASVGPPVRPLALAPPPPHRMAIANGAQIPEEVNLPKMIIDIKVQKTLLYI